jgi:hypothetical protein
MCTYIFCPPDRYSACAAAVASIGSDAQLVLCNSHTLHDRLTSVLTECGYPKRICFIHYDSQPQPNLIELVNTHKQNIPFYTIECGVMFYSKFPGIVVQSSLDDCVAWRRYQPNATAIARYLRSIIKKRNSVNITGPEKRVINYINSRRDLKNLFAILRNMSSYTCVKQNTGKGVKTLRVEMCI